MKLQKRTPAVSRRSPIVMFELDKRLAADTAEIRDLDLCRVLLLKDVRYPWLILVPRKRDLVEVGDLSREDRIALSDETDRAAGALLRLYAPDKMNIAAIGNIVRQLHVHVVARTEGDPAWPGPVWGHSPPEPYDDAALAARISEISAAL
jgi:diadenosine tetraphosphate (Ap4A) HIT family hydrolase